MEEHWSHKPKDESSNLSATIMKPILDRVKRALSASRSLVKPKHDVYDHPLSGMCYIASEAYYHLEGKKLGYKPKRATYKSISHWWLEHPNGLILDLTAAQFPFKFPYKLGKWTAFLTKQPSKRTKQIIALVIGMADMTDLESVAN